MFTLQTLSISTNVKYTHAWKLSLDQQSSFLTSAASHVLSCMLSIFLCCYFCLKMNHWAIKRMMDSAITQGWYIERSPRMWELNLFRLTSVTSLPSPASLSIPCSNKQKTGWRHYTRCLLAEEHWTHWIAEQPACLACLSETGRYLAVWAVFWSLQKSLLISGGKEVPNFSAWVCLHLSLGELNDVKWSGWHPHPWGRCAASSSSKFSI